jgi:hypothetical protein
MSAPAAAPAATQTASGRDADLIVIGAGPGGYRPRFAPRNWARA